MKFADKLRILLNDHGMTQSALAKKLGVSQPTVGYWLDGRRPYPPTAKRLADYFSVPLSDLMEDGRTLPVTSLREVPKKIKDQERQRMERSRERGFATWENLSLALLDVSRESRQLSTQISQLLLQWQDGIVEGEAALEKLQKLKPRVERTLGFDSPEVQEVKEPPSAYGYTNVQPDLAVAEDAAGENNDE